MKSHTPENQPSPSLSPELQARLMVYTTAATLGALFTAQHADAQVVLSHTRYPYPIHLYKGGPNTYGYYGPTYNYLDIDGDGTNDAILNTDTWRTDISGLSATNFFVLNPSSSAYIIPWSNGMVLNTTNGSAPTYHRWFSNSAYGNPGTYLFNNFTNIGALGFAFISGVDNQKHFGYMNLQVLGTPGVYGTFSIELYGIYYNATPNAPITIGPVVSVTNVSVTNSAVTIKFTSTDGADPTNFFVLRSPKLGTNANFQLDTNAVITSIGTNLYQAVTTKSNANAFFKNTK